MLDCLKIIFLFLVVGLTTVRAFLVAKLIGGVAKLA